MLFRSGFETLRDDITQANSLYLEKNLRLDRQSGKAQDAPSVQVTRHVTTIIK